MFVHRCYENNEMFALSKHDSLYMHLKFTFKLHNTGNLKRREKCQHFSFQKINVDSFFCINISYCCLCDTK